MNIRALKPKCIPFGVILNSESDDRRVRSSLLDDVCDTRVNAGAGVIFVGLCKVPFVVVADSWRA